MFVEPIYGSDNVFCDNEAFYKNTITHEYLLKKKLHSIAYQGYKEAVATNTSRVYNKGTENKLSDMFIKIMNKSRRRFLLENFTY